MNYKIQIYTFLALPFFIASSFAAESADFILIDNNLTETQQNSETEEVNGNTIKEEANLVEIQKIGESQDFIEASSYCGNSQIELPEKCDTNNFNGKTCSSFGYDKGTLSCLSNCRVINTSNCSNYSIATPTATPTPTPAVNTGGGGGGGYIPPPTSTSTPTSTVIPTSIPTVLPEVTAIVTPNSTPTPVNTPTLIPTISPEPTVIATSKPIFTSTPQETSNIKNEVDTNNTIPDNFHNSGNTEEEIILKLEEVKKLEQQVERENVNRGFHNAGTEENIIKNENFNKLTELKILNNSEDIRMSNQNNTIQYKLNNKRECESKHTIKSTFNNMFENCCWIWILIAFILGCLTRFIGRNKKENISDDLKHQAEKLKQNL